MQRKTIGMLTLLATLSMAAAVAPQDTLIIQSSSDLPTMDPGATYDNSSAGLVENIYETLVTYKGNSLLQVEPLLATSWAVGNKGKTYTFDLRRNVKFHNGNPFTCEDAEYTFQRNILTNNSSSGNWFMAEPLLGTPNNGYEDKTITWARIDRAVECNKAGQLVFNLAKVDPAFLAKLAYAGQSIVDREYAAKLGEWSGTEKDWKTWVGANLMNSKLSKAPNGTGAYRFQNTDGKKYNFQAFGDYWGRKPNLQNVSWQTVASETARQDAFLKGDADFIDPSGRVNDEQTFKGKAGVNWLNGLPNVTAGAIIMNQMIRDTGQLGSGKLDGKGIPRNFFSDVNVRRAFSYAFNYDEYIQTFLKGQGQQRTMLLPDIFLGYNAKLPTYRFDLNQARQNFQKAWGGQVWKNGFVLTISYREGSASAESMITSLKKNVESLNPKFKVNVQPKKWSELWPGSGSGQEPMMLMSWIPDYADPDNFMYTFYASDGFNAPRSNYRDERADQWLNAARTTLSQSERSYHYSRIGQRAYELAPYIIIPAPSNYLFFRSAVKGLSAAKHNPMLSTIGGVRWKELSK